MAGTTPIYGLPYPQSSDLVSAYPALGQDLATDLDGILAAKANYKYQATAPSSPATGDLWVDSDDQKPYVWTGSAWVPFPSGVAVLAASDVTGTTGSPTISTFTSGGTGYTVYKFTASSGSITLGKAGVCDILIVGGGGGGRDGTQSCGGGGGGVIHYTDFLLQSGANSITVGAGGAIASKGGDSILGSLTAVGGGRGIDGAFSVGGSSGGATSNQFAVPGQGNSGATGSGGLGGGGAGGAASGSTAGVGLSVSITGSAVTYAAGGFGGVGSAPAANTGNGGPRDIAGASGVVIIKMRS